MNPQDIDLVFEYAAPRVATLGQQCSFPSCNFPAFVLARKFWDEHDDMQKHDHVHEPWCVRHYARLVHHITLSVDTVKQLALAFPLVGSGDEEEEEHVLHAAHTAPEDYAANPMLASPVSLAISNPSFSAYNAWLSVMLVNSMFMSFVVKSLFQKREASENGFEGSFLLTWFLHPNFSAHAVTNARIFAAMVEEYEKEGLFADDLDFTLLLLLLQDMAGFQPTRKLLIVKNDETDDELFSFEEDMDDASETFHEKRTNHFKTPPNLSSVPSPSPERMRRGFYLTGGTDKEGAGNAKPFQYVPMSLNIGGLSEAEIKARREQTLQARRDSLPLQFYSAYSLRGSFRGELYKLEQKVYACIQQSASGLQACDALEAYIHEDAAQVVGRLQGQDFKQIGVFSIQIIDEAERASFVSAMQSFLVAQGKQVLKIFAVGKMLPLYDEWTASTDAWLARIEDLVAGIEQVPAVTLPKDKGMDALGLSAAEQNVLRHYNELLRTPLPLLEQAPPMPVPPPELAELIQPQAKALVADVEAKQHAAIAKNADVSAQYSSAEARYKAIVDPLKAGEADALAFLKRYTTELDAATNSRRAWERIEGTLTSYLAKEEYSIAEDPSVILLADETEAQSIRGKYVAWELQLGATITARHLLAHWKEFEELNARYMDLQAWIRTDLVQNTAALLLARCKNRYEGFSLVVQSAASLQSILFLDSHDALSGSLEPRTNKFAELQAVAATLNVSVATIPFLELVRILQNDMVRFLRLCGFLRAGVITVSKAAQAIIAGVTPFAGLTDENQDIGALATKIAADASALLASAIAAERDEENIKVLFSPELIQDRQEEFVRSKLLPKFSTFKEELDKLFKIRDTLAALPTFEARQEWVRNNQTEEALGKATETLAAFAAKFKVELEDALANLKSMLSQPLLYGTMDSMLFPIQENTRHVEAAMEKMLAVLKRGESDEIKTRLKAHYAAWLSKNAERLDANAVRDLTAITEKKREENAAFVASIEKVVAGASTRSKDGAVSTNYTVADAVVTLSNMCAKNDASTAKYRAIATGWLKRIVTEATSTKSQKQVDEILAENARVAETCSKALQELVAKQEAVNKEIEEIKKLFMEEQAALLSTNAKLTEDGISLQAAVQAATKAVQGMQATFMKDYVDKFTLAMKREFDAQLEIAQTQSRDLVQQVMKKAEALKAGIATLLEKTNALQATTLQKLRKFQKAEEEDMVDKDALQHLLDRIMKVRLEQPALVADAERDWASEANAAIPTLNDVLEVRKAIMARYEQARKSREAVIAQIETMSNKMSTRKLRSFTAALRELWKEYTSRISTTREQINIQGRAVALILNLLRAYKEWFAAKGTGGGTATAAGGGVLASLTSILSYAVSSKSAAGGGGAKQPAVSFLDGEQVSELEALIQDFSLIVNMDRKEGQFGDLVEEIAGFQKQRDDFAVDVFVESGTLSDGKSRAFEQLSNDSIRVTNDFVRNYKLIDVQGDKYALACAMFESNWYSFLNSALPSAIHEVKTVAPVFTNGTLDLLATDCRSLAEGWNQRCVQIKDLKLMEQFEPFRSESVAFYEALKQLYENDNTVTNALSLPGDEDALGVLDAFVTKNAEMINHLASRAANPQAFCNFALPSAKKYVVGGRTQDAAGATATLKEYEWVKSTTAECHISIKRSAHLLNVVLPFRHQLLPLIAAIIQDHDKCMERVKEYSREGITTTHMARDITRWCDILQTSLAIANRASEAASRLVALKRASLVADEFIVITERELDGIIASIKAQFSGDDDADAAVAFNLTEIMRRLDTVALMLGADSELSYHWLALKTYTDVVANAHACLTATLDLNEDLLMKLDAGASFRKWAASFRPKLQALLVKLMRLVVENVDVHGAALSSAKAALQLINETKEEAKSAFMKAESTPELLTDAEWKVMSDHVRGCQESNTKMAVVSDEFMKGAIQFLEKPLGQVFPLPGGEVTPQLVAETLAEAKSQNQLYEALKIELKAKDCGMQYAERVEAHVNKILEGIAARIAAVPLLTHIERKTVSIDLVGLNAQEAAEELKKYPYKFSVAKDRGRLGETRVTFMEVAKPEDSEETKRAKAVTKRLVDELTVALQPVSASLKSRDSAAMKQFNAFKAFIDIYCEIYETTRFEEMRLSIHALQKELQYVATLPYGDAQPRSKFVKNQGEILNEKLKALHHRVETIQDLLIFKVTEGTQIGYASSLVINVQDYITTLMFFINKAVNSLGAAKKEVETWLKTAKTLEGTSEPILTAVRSFMATRITKKEMPLINLVGSTPKVDNFIVSDFMPHIIHVNQLLRRYVDSNSKEFVGLPFAMATDIITSSDLISRLYTFLEINPLPETSSRASSRARGEGANGASPDPLALAIQALQRTGRSLPSRSAAAGGGK